MSTHFASVRWNAAESSFLSGQYRRTFTMEFDGGAEISGAASPLVVPPRLTDAGSVDPEEMLVAAVSSCHMLWFLSFASKAGVDIASYEDEAFGELTHADQTRPAQFTRIVLRPKLRFAAGAEQPDAVLIDALHEKAHHACFIANSLKPGLVQVEINNYNGLDFSHR